MKKTTLVAAVLAVLWASQAMASQQIPAPSSFTSPVTVFETDVFLSSSSEELRAYRNWKKQADGDKTAKEYRRWKKERSDSSSSWDGHYRERREKQENNDQKTYERWKKRHPDSKKTYKEWKKERDAGEEAKDFEKWRKKHRKDWRKWNKDRYGNVYEQTNGDGDGAGSGGAE